MAAKEKKTVMPSLEDESPSEEEIFSSSASPPSHPQYMLHVDVEANLDQIVYVGRSPLTPTEEQYSPTAPALGTPASMLFKAAAASKAAAAAPAAVAAKANTGFLQPLAKKRKRPQAGADSEDWVNCQEEAGCAKAKAKARVLVRPKLFSAWDGPWLNNRLLPCHTCQEHGSDSDESHDHGPHVDPEGKYRDTCKHMCPLCNTGEGAGKDVDMTSMPSLTSSLSDTS